MEEQNNQPGNEILKQDTDPVSSTGRLKSVQNDNIRKSIFKRWPFWLVVALIIISFGGVFALGKTHKKSDESSIDNKKESGVLSFKWPDPTAKYVTASPVDLTQIQSISKYRSCAGHIRDGYNFDRELELDRSMKHYLLPTPEFQSTNDKVKLFAPFDGSIIRLDLEKDKPDYGRKSAGNGIHLSTTVDPSIDFGIGHMYFTKEFKAGDKVTAGELLGYAATDCGLGRPGCDFDLDLSTPGGTSAYNGREVLGSIFDHMTDPVLAEFAKYGITPDNTKFTKEYRDANLCGYDKPEEQKTVSKEEKIADFDGHHNADNVQLVH